MLEFELRRRHGTDVLPLHAVTKHRQPFGYVVRRRDQEKPLEEWVGYFDSKEAVWKEAPYKDRALIMRNLCEKRWYPGVL